MLRIKRLRDLIWLPVETEREARMLVLPCLAFAFLGAFVRTAIAIGGFFFKTRYSHWNILFAIILILIAWGLYKMRREAAIAGFIISISSVITDWGSYQAIRDVVAVILYVYAVRGTFAHRYFVLLAHNQETE